jgi:hypothetical protein
LASPRGGKFVAAYDPEDVIRRYKEAQIIERGLRSLESTLKMP